MKPKCLKRYTKAKAELRPATRLELCGGARDTRNAENLVLLNCGITNKVLKHMNYEELGILSSILGDALLAITTRRAELIG